MQNNETLYTYLSERLGWDTEKINPNTIERALRRIQSHPDWHDRGHTVEVILANPVWKQILLESLSVPETWFFRDRDVFAYLKDFAIKEMKQTTPRRILCTACSTGEEAYSIAMTLLDAGWQSTDFSIDAIDLSESSIEKAKCGVYGLNSFRNVSNEIRERNFHEIQPGQFRIHDRYRHSIRFETGNLLHPALFIYRQHYSIVFCKNLMIYLHSKANEQLLQSLDKILRPDGVFFTGAAETAMVSKLGFSPLPVPRTFGFRKPLIGESMKLPTFSIDSHKPLEKPVPREPTVESTPVPNPVKKKAEIPTIEFVRQLADQGRHDEAFEQCNLLLRETGPSADLYALMGLIVQSQSHTGEAETFYQRALYLNPHHYESLIHMIYLTERNGGYAQAKLYRERAKRIEEMEGAAL